jgi:hypothetical protein
MFHRETLNIQLEMLFRKAERDESRNPDQHEDWGDEEKPSNDNIPLQKSPLTFQYNTLATFTLILTWDSNRKGTLMPIWAAK